MKLSRRIVVSGLFLVCAVQVQCTLGPGLSTPDQRAKVVALTRSLERDPLIENAPATRQWLRKWIIEVPDIRVYACDDLLGHGLGDNYPYSTEVKLQPIFSAAAFAIEHPDKARDEHAQHYAGVEGALRVYEALLKSKADASSAFLDDLLAKRDHGELADHVAKLAKEKCKRSNFILIANLVGTGVALVLGLLVAWGFGGRPAARVTGSGGVAGENGSARIATILQRVVFVSAGYYLIVGIALHVLEPEFDPRFRFMSEYALSAHGWLMTTTFFVLGLAAFAVAVALRNGQQSLHGARIGFGLLAVGALFLCLAGVFKDSIPHLLASVVALPSIVMAVFFCHGVFGRLQGGERFTEQRSSSPLECLPRSCRWSPM
jgi:preprotein translocase subunit SecG